MREKVLSSVLGGGGLGVGSLVHAGVAATSHGAVAVA